jgi:hypothetical protein
MARPLFMPGPAMHGPVGAGQWWKKKGGGGEGSCWRWRGLAQPKRDAFSARRATSPRDFLFSFIRNLSIAPTAPSRGDHHNDGQHGGSTDTAVCPAFEPPGQ